MPLSVPVPQHNRSSDAGAARPNIRAMKVTVDPVACEANAVCARLVPQVFSIYEDEDGEDALAIANNSEVPAEHAAGVRDAVTRCPKMALTLDE
jgi:ferredoxin